MIRRYAPTDAVTLAPIHSAVFADDPLSAADFHDYLAAMLVSGGSAWVIVDGQPLGYALTTPVPGLPHIADLKGCIAPAWRRQGLGSRLLRRVLTDLAGSEAQQVAHAVEDLGSVAALFLRANDFFVEHEEWLLCLDDLKQLPRAERTGAVVTTLPRNTAIADFAGLYGSSFSGRPWNQPFNKAEIGSMLVDAKDLLFLIVDGRPVGFAWVHLVEGRLGLIEPLGILPAYQGQGYGRFLMLSTLHELARRGARRAQIGAWRTNETAMHLYQSLGFVHRKTVTYLAYDLHPH